MKIIVNETIKLKTETEGPKFMLMARANSDRGLDELHPLLLKRCLDVILEEPPTSVKRLRDGKILVETKTLEQAKALATLIQIDQETLVNVTLHPRLNQCKGVVWSREFRYIADKELLEALKDQGVTGIQRMKKKKMGEQEETDTGTYFLFFDSQEVPQYIMCGYEKVTVREFIPEPQRCFKCLQFGHFQSECYAKERICGNCNETAHVDWKTKEVCDKPRKCANCQSDQHGSLFKKCPAYIKEAEIQLIGKNEKVDPIEARKRYRSRYQKDIFPSMADKPGTSKEGSGCNDCNLCDKLKIVIRELQRRLEKTADKKKEPPEKKTGQKTKIKDGNDRTKAKGPGKPNTDETDDSFDPSMDLDSDEIPDSDKEEGTANNNRRSGQKHTRQVSPLLGNDNEKKQKK